MQNFNFRRIIQLLTITAAQLLIVMNNAMMNIALPLIQESLRISDGARQWGITVYLLMFGSLLLPAGRVVDRIGRRRAFIVGLAGTAASSAVAGTSVSSVMFFVARGAQGASAALVAPAALALISVCFHDPTYRQKAVALYGAVTGVGSAAGLVVGGLLSDLLSWRWALFLSIPVSCISIWAAVKYVPESRSSIKLKYHPINAIVVTGGIAALIMSLTLSAQRGWLDAVTLATFFSGISLIIIFAITQKGPDALVPPRLLADSLRVIGLLTVAIGALALAGVFVLLSYYMQRILSMSPLRAAMATAPFALGMFCSSQLAGQIPVSLDRIKIIAAGFTVSAVSLVPLCFINEQTSYWRVILPCLLGLSAGIGPAFVSGTTAAIGIAAEHCHGEAGVIGALASSASEIGSAIGVALLNTIAVAATKNSTQPGSEVSGYATAFIVSATILIVGSGLILILGTASKRHRNLG